MIDERDLLERALHRFEPQSGLAERVYRRRDQKRRNQRIRAGVLGLAIAIVLVVGGIGLIRSSAPTTIPGDQGQPTRPPGTTTGETNGTWTGPCADSQDGPPPQVCLGPLDEGTYTSQRFEPAVTFTVPAGWNNGWDTRGSFDLWTPGWSDGWDDRNDPGLYVFDHPGLSLFRDVRPLEVGCSDRVDPTVGTSAIEVATWVANHPGIAAGAPSPVEVGGLSGYQLDVSIAETWQSCPIDGAPATVPLLDQLGGLIRHPGYATMRLIMLDLPDGGNVAIEIDGAQVDAAMPVVSSFEFDLG